MATEIVYQQWCDVCLRADDRREDVVFSADVALDGKVARHIDLCQRHAETMIAATSLLDTYGTTASKIGNNRPTTGGDQVCSLCGKEGFASRGSLGSHYRQVHQRNLSDVEGSTRPKRDKPIKCEVCGETMMSPQGLGAHKRGRHGIKGESVAMQRERSRQPILEDA